MRTASRVEPKIELETEFIRANPDNPRTDMDPTTLRGLADSMDMTGLLQPIIVTETSGSEYTIICGHRRYAAAKLLGWPTIPAIIIEATPEQAREIALIENMQREDLSPLDEARIIGRLFDGGQSVVEIACGIGRGYRYVMDRLALLNPLDPADSLDPDAVTEDGGGDR